MCRGLAKGPARVVVDLLDARNIKCGDILITRSTDIGWSPYFPLLAGVVTEIGGLISHGNFIFIFNFFNFNFIFIFIFLLFFIYLRTSARFDIPIVKLRMRGAFRCTFHCDLFIESSVDFVVCRSGDSSRVRTALHRRRSEGDVIVPLGRYCRSGRHTRNSFRRPIIRLHIRSQKFIEMRFSFSCTRVYLRQQYCQHMFLFSCLAGCAFERRIYQLFHFDLELVHSGLSPHSIIKHVSNQYTLG